MPDFLFTQYPKFPQSKVFQQRAALEELTNLGLFKDGKLVPQEGLSNPSVNVDVNADADVEGESEGEIKINIPFTTWWDVYNKKRGREKAEKKWLSLSDAERESCMKHSPIYVKSTPDVSFRKDPLTYLNGRAWEDEIIEPVNNRTVYRFRDTDYPLPEVIQQQ